MDKVDAALAAFLLIFVFCPFLLFLLLIATAPNQEWQREAIERGYGMYCPTTGEFAWKGECE